MNTIDTTVNVSGMTCAHCVASVTEELSEVDGVQSVTVDLNAGGVSPVTIQSTRELTEGEIAAAVEEAGYGIA